MVRQCNRTELGMISSHNPTLSLVSVASAFANTASTVTTLTTGTDVPAGSLVAVTCQIQAAVSAVGTITLTASAGGIGTQTYTNFQSNSTDGACHSLLVFTVPSLMPSGTTLTVTRSVTWNNAEIRMILCTNCTRQANQITTTHPGATASSVLSNSLTFTSGTVSVSHYIASGINIVLGSSNSNTAVAGIGGGGNPAYVGAGMIAVQGGAGTVNGAPGTGFRYLVATTIYPLVNSITSQTFLMQTGAATQNWCFTQYRLTPA